HHIARYGENAWADDLLKIARKEPAEKLDQQLPLFRKLMEGTQARGASLTTAEKSWGENLAHQLVDAPDDALATAGVELCGSLKIQSLENKLASLALDKKKPEVRRGAALAALPTIDAKHIELLGHVLMDDSEPAGLREKAANVLGGLNQPTSLGELI